MTIPKFEQLTGEEKLPDLIEIVAKLQKQVQWLLDGKLGNDNIRANSITAHKLDVDELSAISADLGTIEAGEVYGAYISTGHNYPKVELSNTENLIQASQASNKFILVTPIGTSGTPSISIFDGAQSINGLIYVSAAGRFVIAPSGAPINIAGGVNNVLIDGANVIINGVNFTTKADKSSVSKTVYVASSSGGAATTPLTITNGIVTS